jgi:flagellar basal-body rod protein FlgB
MFIDRLLNQGSPPALEQLLQFTEKRQGLLAEDVANVDTPNFIQKDLSVTDFQDQLQNKIDQANESAPGTVNFDDISTDVQDAGGLMFHDGNNRSMEELMTDQAKNALIHNVAVELLRRQFMTLNNALKEQLG